MEDLQWQEVLAAHVRAPSGLVATTSCSSLASHATVSLMSKKGSRESALSRMTSSRSDQPRPATLSSVTSNVEESLLATDPEDLGGLPQRPTEQTEVDDSVYRRMSIALPLLHFTIGINNNVQSVAWTKFLIDAGIAPPDKALLTGVVCSLPWNLKIFVAFLSDVVPIFGRRRVPYLFVGLALQAAAWTLLGFAGKTVSFPMLALQQFCATMGQVLHGVRGGWDEWDGWGVH